MLLVTTSYGRRRQVRWWSSLPSHFDFDFDSPMQAEGAWEAVPHAISTALNKAALSIFRFLLFLCCVFFSQYLNFYIAWPVFALAFAWLASKGHACQAAIPLIPIPSSTSKYQRVQDGRLFHGQWGKILLLAGLGTWSRESLTHLYYSAR